jgi:hypothetical protein
LAERSGFAAESVGGTGKIEMIMKMVDLDRDMEIADVEKATMDCT